MTFVKSRGSLFHSATHNMTKIKKFFLCKIPFDDCRCSVLSKTADKSMDCITDTQAMAGHVLPLLSYVLQLYLIYKLVSITGKYSYILTEVFWVTALFIFVIITVAIQGGSCLHFYTDVTISFTGYVISWSVVFLWLKADRHGSPYRRRGIPVIITLF